jgi:hypothetical protein
VRRGPGTRRRRSPRRLPGPRAPRAGVRRRRPGRPFCSLPVSPQAAVAVCAGPAGGRRLRDMRPRRGPAAPGARGGARRRGGAPAVRTVRRAGQRPSPHKKRRSGPPVRRGRLRARGGRSRERGQGERGPAAGGVAASPPPGPRARGSGTVLRGRRSPAAPPGGGGVPGCLERAAQFPFPCIPTRRGRPPPRGRVRTKG